MRPTTVFHSAARFAAAAGVTSLVAAAVVLSPTIANPPGAQAQADPGFVERVLASLTPEERVGQTVMVNFVNDDVSPESDIGSLIRDFHVGGVLLSASNGNIVNSGDTPARIAALTNSLQDRAFASSRRSDGASEYFTPLLIATDNEGDLFPLSNATNGYTAVPNNMTIGATWSKAHARATGEIVGRELSAAGINMLLGPVVDVLDNPRSGGSGDIGIRSFGGSPAWVGQLGRAYIEGVHTGGGGRMLTVAKHFPGHGGSDRSADNEVPVVNKSLVQLRATELAPFAAAVRADKAEDPATTDAVMVSHIRYRNFLPGASNLFTGPISIDDAAFRGLMDLPEFAGWRSGHLVMSDSLGVQAVKNWYAQLGEPGFPNRTVVHDALMAGSDLLPLTEFNHDPAHPGWKDNQLPVIQDSILFMREAYADDPAFRRRVDDAVRHVIEAKLKLYPQLQLSQTRADAAQASAAAGQGDEEMHALAEDALTLLQPPSVDELHARLPRGPQSPEKVVIVECWADCYPYRIKPKLDLQNTLLALYGPSGKARLKPEDVSTISFAELDGFVSKPDDPQNVATRKAITDAAWIVFALTEYNPDGRPASGAVKRFLDAVPLDVRNKNLVGVAFNVPYHLDSTEISKLSAYFAVYSKTQASIETAFRALFGDADPKGHAPVNVSGVFYNVAEATQPARGQQLALSVYGQDPNNVRDTGVVGLAAGPLVDGNGTPVPDGTAVTFVLTRDGSAATTASATTIDGVAGAQLATHGPGNYAATASAANIVSAALAITVGSGAPAAPSPETANGSTTSSGSGPGVMLLAAAIGVPSALALAIGAVVVVQLRRRRAVTPDSAIAARLADEPSPVMVEPQALRIDGDTRRVYVKGIEAVPPLSNEQFRLLWYLYERAGKVVGREELVGHVWPDANTEGVSEEALDALVRRVRERIAQAGGERSYIVTLRGQGFRLEVDGAAPTVPASPRPQ